jgi:hypothetical protein
MPKTDTLGRRRAPKQDAALARVNSERRVEGARPTKALRFTLPEPLADKLEAMTKAERDALMAQALKSKTPTGS